MEREHAPTRRGGRWRTASPRYWGISIRAAAVSAAAVAAALVMATAGILALLYAMLLSGVDDAAAARVTDIVAAMRLESPAALDERLMSTNQHVAAVQVVDANKHVVRRSSGAPTSPLGPCGAIRPHADSGPGTISHRATTCG